MGAGTDAEAPPRFPSPLIKPDVPDFEHPAFRLTSPQSSRKCAQLDTRSRSTPKLAEHRCVRETGGASRRHLVTPSQEMPHALIDVVDRPLDTPSTASRS